MSLAQSHSRSGANEARKGVPPELTSRRVYRRRGGPFGGLPQCFGFPVNGPENERFVARFTTAGRIAISNAACIAAGMEAGR